MKNCPERIIPRLGPNLMNNVEPQTCKFFILDCEGACYSALIAVFGKKKMPWLKDGIKHDSGEIRYILEIRSGESKADPIFLVSQPGVGWRKTTESKVAEWQQPLRPWGLIQKGD